MKTKKPKYDHLLVPATEIPKGFKTLEASIPVLFVLLSGREDRGKKIKILNEMLIDWVGDKKKMSSNSKQREFPTPSTLNTMVRGFFAATKDQYCWEYSPNDFRFDGGFAGFFKALCQKRQVSDVSFAKKITYLSPHSSSFSHTSIPLNCAFFHSRVTE